MKEDTKSSPNNSAATSILVAPANETFLFCPTSVFSFQFYYLDTLDDCQEGIRQCFICLLLKEVRLFQ